MSLMVVCRSTRALAIGLEYTAELTVWAGSDQPAEQWGRLLHAVPRDLGARDRPTQVQVAVPGDAGALLHPDTHRLFSAPSRAATHVTVGCPVPYWSDAISDLLAAPGMANLHFLHTDICPTTMPDPAVLPQLKELSFQLDNRDPKRVQKLFCSTAPFLSQLTYFKCDVCHLSEQQPFPLSDLFYGTTPSTTLTDLQLPVPLDFQLLTLLNRHAPCVKKLSVSGVTMGAIRGFTWGVEELMVAEGELRDDFFVYLPKRAKGRLGFSDMAGHLLSVDTQVS